MSARIPTYARFLQQIDAVLDRDAGLRDAAPSTALGEVDLDSLEFAEMFLALSNLYPGLDENLAELDTETTLHSLYTFCVSSIGFDEGRPELKS